jgi:hypothetical protein
MGKPDGKQAKPGKRVFSTVPPLWYHVEFLPSSSGYGSFTDMGLSNDILMNLSFWNSISLRFLIWWVE